MNTQTIKKILMSLITGTYLTMILTLLYLIITKNSNLFNNGTLGIETIFICFTLTIICGMVLILLNQLKNKI